MATINQQAAPLALVGVFSNPLTLLVDIASITTSTGASVGWNSASVAAAIVTDQYGNSISGGLPTISSPEVYQFQLSWSAAQSSLISNSQNARWALELTIEGIGPSAILSGPLTFVPPTWPGASSETTATVVVTVGTSVVDLTVNLGGGAGLGLLTSTDNSIAITTPTTGSANLSVAHVDGGNAYAD